MRSAEVVSGRRAAAVGLLADGPAERWAGSEAAMSPGTGPVPPAMRPLLLVVEDEDATRAALAALLRDTGYEVVAVTSAEEALAWAAALRPAAILMDLALPAVSGLDAARTLKEEPATACIPLIATTGSWLGERRDLLAGAGFDGALRKPFTEPELVREVGRVLHVAAGVR